MYISLKDNPEFNKYLNMASGEKKTNECELRVFPEYGIAMESNWSGGTKYWYTLIDMVTNKVLPIPENGNIGQPSTPELKVLPPNFCLVETLVFCGKKMTARIYMNQENLTKAIPENKIELTDEEGTYLKEYRSLKSSYRIKNERLLNLLKAKNMIAANNSVTTLGKNWGR